jgi:predicted nucleic acid-binding protein
MLRLDASHQMRTTLTLHDNVLAAAKVLATCTPAVVTPVLRALVAHPQHQFWGATPSLLNELAVETSTLLDPGLISDTYLLALAVHEQGVLAMVDRRIQAQNVLSGADALSSSQRAAHPNAPLTPTAA